MLTKQPPAPGRPLGPVLFVVASLAEVWLCRSDVSGESFFDPGADCMSPSKADLTLLVNPDWTSTRACARLPAGRTHVGSVSRPTTSLQTSRGVKRAAARILPPPLRGPCRACGR